MGETTGISWTDHSFNCWWGCQRVSPGCENCYAEAFDKRTGGAHWGPGERRFFGEKHWAEPLKWNAAAEKAGVRRRVFCASMADVFEDRRDLDAERAKLWPLILATPALDWLLLTKRPENVPALAPYVVWPRNVWIGTTVEDQKRADERIPLLRAVPAAVRFLSAEPLLEPLDLYGRLDGIDWVIVGAESGPGARPFKVQWIQDIAGACRHVALFIKQIGAAPADLDIKLRDRKGGDMSEWPEWLRVRQFPEVKP